MDFGFGPMTAHVRDEKGGVRKYNSYSLCVVFSEELGLKRFLCVAVFHMQSHFINYTFSHVDMTNTCVACSMSLLSQVIQSGEIRYS